MDAICSSAWPLEVQPPVRAKRCKSLASTLFSGWFQGDGISHRFRHMATLSHHKVVDSWESRRPKWDLDVSRKHSKDL